MKAQLRVRRNKTRYCQVALAATLMLGSSTLARPADSSALEMARRLNEAFIEVAEKVSPAVVVIEVALRPDFKDPENGEDPLLEMLPPDLRRHFEDRLDKRRQERTPNRRPVYEGRGSGIVVRADGWILTNAHVVDGAERIRVRFKDGKTYEALEGKWFTDSQSDIAVLRVDAQGLTPARLADSGNTRVGEFAVAIGAPFELDYSVTFGHVSAKGRTHVIPSWPGNTQGAAMDQDFIQTDASINPGNSGGPLVNIDGEVIGVNTLIRGLNRGIGFAIPSNLARQVSDQLIAEGKFARAWLGVKIAALSEEVELKEFMPELVKELADGVVVKELIPNGPASKSGLKPADIILSVDGTPVASAQQLRNAVRARKIGEAVILLVVRPDSEGKRKDLKISLKTEEWPDEAVTAARATGRSPVAAPTGLGLTVQTLTKDLAEKFGVELTEGVIVTAVEPDSPAARERIANGDIITEVNRKPVTNPKDFREAVKGANGKGALVHLISDGAPEYRILKGSGD